MANLYSTRMQLRQQINLEHYESFWQGQMDGPTLGEIQSAQKVIRDTLGDTEADKFIVSSGFQKVPTGSQYPGYTQTIMDLEQYELKIKALIDRMEQGQL